MAKKAIILGARLGSNNIGDGVFKALQESEHEDWYIRTHDCLMRYGGSRTFWGQTDSFVEYRVPELENDDGGNAYEDADALVVTLGKTSMDHFDEIDPEKIEAVIHACLTLPLQAVAHYVAERGMRGGRVVLIGSYAHRHPFTAGTAYCAAKAGIDMAAKTLGWELTQLGFYVTAVHPYHVPGTPMWEQVQKGVMENKQMTRHEADNYAEKDAMLPLMEPIQIGRMVRMLLELPEARYLSGTGLELNGGTR